MWRHLLILLVPSVPVTIDTVTQYNQGMAGSDDLSMQEDPATKESWRRYPPGPREVMIVESFGNNRPLQQLVMQHVVKSN